MTRAEYLFVIVWIINFIISVLYYLWGALFYVPARERQDKNEEEYLHDNRRTYLIRVIVMVLCPIVGPLFFLVSHLIYMTIFRQEVDLDDVIFSKERVKTNVKADEERERNLVPIEEALAVSDKKNLRMLMLNVIRGDLQDSLESISLALNSEDSETSHYAASVLRDELNDFRVTVQKIYTDMKEEEPDQTDSEEMLIDYMNRILCQKVFTEIEQAKFKVSIWCERLVQQYPEELASYTCRLKLYFMSNDKEHFFTVMDQLKKSDIIIDNETLELIRVFS